MFLFGGGGKSEKVAAAELREYLNRAFDRKLDALDRKGKAIIDRIEASRQTFIQACDRLEAVDREPNLDFAFGGRVNYIKSLKNAYATALRRTISTREGGEAKETVYGTYSAELASLDSLMTKMLQTNMEFKQVLSAYGNEMHEFKRQFASMEQLKDELEREIELRGADFGEYAATSEAIVGLLNLIEDGSRLKSELSAVRLSVSKSAPAERGKVEELRTVLDAKLAKSRELSASLSSVIRDVEMAVRPMERAAKKFDYTSGSMMKIGAIAEDPVAHLVHGDVDYAEFAKSTEGMCRKLESGELEAKGADRIMQSVYRVIGGEVQKQVIQAKWMISEKRMVEEEIGSVSSEIRIFESSEHSARKLSERAADIERMLAELSGRKAESAKAIEGLFLKHYRKRISIVT